MIPAQPGSEHQEGTDAEDISDMESIPESIDIVPEEATAGNAGATSEELTRRPSASDPDHPAQFSALQADYDSVIISMIFGVILAIGPVAYRELDKKTEPTPELVQTLEARAWKLSFIEQERVILRYHNFDKVMAKTVPPDEKKDAGSSDYSMTGNDTLAEAFRMLRESPAESYEWIQESFDTFNRAPIVWHRYLDASQKVLAGMARLTILAVWLLCLMLIKVLNVWAPYCILAEVFLNIDASHGQLRWVVFALFNLLTGTLYYLVAFNGAGTYDPGWLFVFG